MVRQRRIAEPHAPPPPRPRGRVAQPSSLGWSWTRQSAPAVTEGTAPVGRSRSSRSQTLVERPRSSASQNRAKTSAWPCSRTCSISGSNRASPSCARRCTSRSRRPRAAPRQLERRRPGGNHVRPRRTRGEALSTNPPPWLCLEFDEDRSFDLERCGRQVRAGLPQHFLYLREESHQQGLLRGGGHAWACPRAARSAA
jgi:hypothetical protein